MEKKKERNIQPEQNEETIIKKSRKGLGTSGTTLKVPIIEIPEGEEEEQENENLFEQIMKENSPNMAKEIDMQVQETQRAPKKLDPRSNTPRHIIIKLPKMKDKERIFKAAREKETVTSKGVPRRLSADFSKETLQAGRSWKELFKVMKGKDLHPR